MNFSLITDGTEFRVTSEYVEIFATLEADGRLLVRSWYDVPPFLNLKDAINFLIRNTEEEIDVIPGPTGFWQSLGFTMVDKEGYRWRYLR